MKYMLEKAAPTPEFAAALIRNSMADVLASSPHLDAKTWSAMLDALPGVGLDSYPYALTKNLTVGRVQRLLNLGPRLGLNNRQASDVDLYSSFVLATEPSLSRRTITSVLRAKRPYTSGALLKHTSATLADKAAAAPHAHAGSRAKWLASPEAVGLDDDYVWSALGQLSEVEECLEETMFDNDHLEAAARYGAVVLHLRPALRDKAVASSDPAILMAASQVELSAAQQEVLASSLELSWHGLRVETLMKSLDRGVYDSQRPLHPLALVAVTPWATEATCAAALAAGVLLEADGALAAPDHLGYRREPYVLVPAALRSSPTPQGWANVVDSYQWTRYGSPMVALFLLESRTLDAVGRQSARADLRHRAHVSHALRAHSRRVKPSQPYGSEPLTYTEPTRRESAKLEEPASAALPSIPVSSMFYFQDRGMTYLAAQHLSDVELDTFVCLLPSFTGTLGELVEVARGA